MFKCHICNFKHLFHHSNFFTTCEDNSLLNYIFSSTLHTCKFSNYITDIKCLNFILFILKLYLKLTFDQIINDIQLTKNLTFILITKITYNLWGPVVSGVLLRLYRLGLWPNPRMLTGSRTVN